MPSEQPLNSVGQPIVAGKERVAMQKEGKRLYNLGWSIRDISERWNKSYGFTHRILVESGVKLRSRGGYQRGSRDTP